VRVDPEWDRQNGKNAMNDLLVMSNALAAMREQNTGLAALKMAADAEQQVSKILQQAQAQAQAKVAPVSGAKGSQIDVLV
jgi:hypothetical protein